MSSVFQEDIFANFNIIYRTGGHFLMQTGTDWSRQNIIFEQNKFYFITHGICNITINGKDYSGKPGDWFFLPAYVPHSYYNDPSQPYGLYSVHFDLYPKMNMIELLDIDFKVTATEDSDSWSVFSRFADLNESNKLCGKIEIKACLFNLMKEFLRLANQENTIVKSKSNHSLNQVLTYIRETLSSAITNQQLADIAHMHLNHFIRFFKNKTGETPQQYITNRRIDMAKQLLDQTDISLTAIAELVGFYDSSHFSKCFKNNFNISPLQYRKLVRTKSKQETARTRFYQEIIHKNNS